MRQLVAVRSAPRVDVRDRCKGPTYPALYIRQDNGDIRPSRP